VPFLYLHQGKLFRMETDDHGLVGTTPPEGDSRKSARRLEYFWLCKDCAAELTLIFTPGVGIAIKPLAAAQSATAS
jgi:hypothetical protein